MLTVKKYLKDMFTAITALGSAYFYSALVIFLLLIGMRNIAIQIIIGLLLSYFFVILLRIFYFKERPEKEEYFNFFTKINASSFPSLHTLTSVYIATVLSRNLLILSVTIFLYILSLLIAYSRIYLKKHYYSDVLMGLFIGMIASLVYLYLI